VIGNGTLSGRYRKVGKTLEVAIYFLAGSTTTFGSSLWGFSSPMFLESPRFFDAQLQLAFDAVLGQRLYNVGEWKIGQGMALGTGTWDIDAIAIAGLVVNDVSPKPVYYNAGVYPLPASSAIAGKMNGFIMFPATATSSSVIALASIGATSPFTWATGHYMFFSARVELL
jgi:hypothetical protein